MKWAKTKLRMLRGGGKPPTADRGAQNSPQERKDVVDRRARRVFTGTIQEIWLGVSHLFFFFFFRFFLVFHGWFGLVWFFLCLGAGWCGLGASGVCLAVSHRHRPFLATCELPRSGFLVWHSWLLGFHVRSRLVAGFRTVSSGMSNSARPVDSL